METVFNKRFEDGLKNIKSVKKRYKVSTKEVVII